MVYRILLASLLFLLPAFAQASVVTESDTGIIFAERRCRIESVELVDVAFRAGSFDYLYALVTWDYTCRRRNGRQYKVRATEGVSFPELQYDEFDQVWLWGDTAVAERSDWNKVSLLGDFFHTMWSSVDDQAAISFRVQIEKP